MKIHLFPLTLAVFVCLVGCGKGAATASGGGTAAAAPHKMRPLAELAQLKEEDILGGKVFQGGYTITEGASPNGPKGDGKTYMGRGLTGPTSPPKDQEPEGIYDVGNSVTVQDGKVVVINLSTTGFAKLTRIPQGILRNTGAKAGITWDTVLQTFGVSYKDKKPVTLSYDPTFSFSDYKSFQAYKLTGTTGLPDKWSAYVVEKPSNAVILIASIVPYGIDDQVANQRHGSLESGSFAPPYSH
jgi:hypothetical protein